MVEPSGFREFAVIVSREMLASGKVDYAKLELTMLQFEQDFQVAEDSQSVTHRWLRLLDETNTSGKQVHDANLVATMLTYDIETILTNNVTDFQRFSHLITIEPLI